MLDPMLRRRGLLGLASLATLGACTTQVKLGPEAVAGKRPDGTVEMTMTQAAFIGSGGGGTGTLHFRGRSYPFTVANAGIGGIGASNVEADGEVYNLREASAFPGVYGQARYGYALGERSAGEIWLQNEAGVIMRLRARRTGLMLSLGGDAVVITMRN